MLCGYLPFDDDPDNPSGENIGQLYSYIVSAPLTFPDHVTPGARSLLRRILQPDPRLRIDMAGIWSHRWLRDHRSLFDDAAEPAAAAAAAAGAATPGPAAEGPEAAGAPASRAAAAAPRTLGAALTAGGALSAASPGAAAGDPPADVPAATAAPTVDDGSRRRGEPPPDPAENPPALPGANRREARPPPSPARSPSAGAGRRRGGPPAPKLVVSTQLEHTPLPPRPKSAMTGAAAAAAGVFAPEISSAPATLAAPREDKDWALPRYAASSPGSPTAPGAGARRESAGKGRRSKSAARPPDGRERPLPPPPPAGAAPAEHDRGFGPAPGKPPAAADVGRQKAKRADEYVSSSSKKVVEWLRRHQLWPGSHRPRSGDSDDVLAEHSGAVDASAVTARRPSDVFPEVEALLGKLGVEVTKREGKYKLRCRPAKRQTAAKPGQSGVAPPAETRRSGAAAPGRENGGGPRTSTRATAGAAEFSAQTLQPLDRRRPSQVGQTAGSADDDVHFVVEVRSLRNLPGMMILDVRRLKGNIWAFKHIRSEILRGANLSQR
ncbi:MAG: hypothetical protein BJ554DRAFT_7442 [Olpidium bornovanus]|uniref:non-specific serine/threonine protein kinase n=1 Tax=Olpidium bornovanus TaxID=278681 RepID=A0A8H7ZWX3_9FUNG|nr:MAG: hypothetical protein BJ554DRAFT_7442 [Olpidium bornovanus]